VRIPTKSIQRFEQGNCGNFLLFFFHFPSARCSFLGQKDLGSWLNGFFPSFPAKGLLTFFVGQWMKGKIYFPQAGKEKLSKQTNKSTTKTEENRKSRKVSPPPIFVAVFLLRCSIVLPWISASDLGLCPIFFVSGALPRKRGLKNSVKSICGSYLSATRKHSTHSISIPHTTRQSEIVWH